MRMSIYIAVAVVALHILNQNNIIHQYAFTWLST